MGTSRSRPDPAPNTPAIPPWASPAPGGGEAGGEVPAPSRRFQTFRTKLGDYAGSGNTADLRAALGHWVRTSRGGSHTGALRVGRSIRHAAGALAALARAAADQTPETGSLDVRALRGRPRDEVIDQIVDHFCPPGIVDDVITRIAVGEALAEVLEDTEDFDPALVEEDMIQEAILAVIAQLVFVGVMNERGNAMEHAEDPLAVVQRENGVRSLVREVTRQKGTPIVRGAGALVTQRTIAQAARAVTQAVLKEIEQW